jgi:Fe-S cluster biogenesis protein NfuA
MRRMFIQVEETPNIHALKFKPGKPVSSTGRVYEFTPTTKSVPHSSSPLARKLLTLPGVRSVLLAGDFISVNKSEDMEWAVIKADIFATIMDFYQSNLPLVQEQPASEGQSAGNGGATMEVEPDSELVLMIKELLDARIRPAVQDDGGDIEFVSFTPEDGIVRLKMQGSCRGCSSSAVTLKSGIENMLKVTFL